MQSTVSQQEMPGGANGFEILTIEEPIHAMRELAEAALFEASPGSREELETLHRIDHLRENIELYRQVLFDLFRTDQFQLLYQSLARKISKLHWDPASALAQRTPTARIQPALGGESVSFHTDGWYGHGEQVASYWVPLTNVHDSNSSTWQILRRFPVRLLPKSKVTTPIFP